MAKVYLKMKNDTRERFYRLKEKLVEREGRKLTHDDVMEYLFSCAEEGIGERGKELLVKVKEALEKVTGRKFTLDDAVEFLVSYLVGDGGNDRDEKVWSVLEKKKEFVKGFYQEPLEPLTYADVTTRFIYVPDRVFEKVKARANGNPPLIFLLTAAEQGAEVYGRYLGVVSDPQLNHEVVSYVNRLSKDVRERFISETQKHFQRAVKEVLRRFKRKYR